MVAFGIAIGVSSSSNRRSDKDSIQEIGFTHIENFDSDTINIPISASIYDSIRDVITSDRFPEVTIFSIEGYTGSSRYITRIFSFTSAKNERYPKFILKPEIVYFGKKVTFEFSSDFTRIFSLNSLDDNKNIQLVTNIFSNTALQESIFKDLKSISAEYIHIESNGSQIFYYWPGDLFYTQNLLDIVATLTKFHETYLISKTK